MRAVFDPLVVEDETGAPQPYLLESFEANDDFTVWTLRMRPGIRFHDGTPAGADALAIHVQNLKAGALTGQLLRRIESWEIVDELTLKVYSNAPFAGLVSGLTGQFGYLPAPSQYADPDGAANPVGTGPFVFKSWIPDQELVVERNPDYWRTDAEGRALPYLDRIVFRPIIEPDARKLAMQTGDIDVTHSDIGLDFDDYRENFKTVEERSFLQSYYLLMNNARPPFNDIRARQALAHCTDHETYNLLRTGGHFDIANGPFGPSTPGHLADTGFPGYDLEAGTVPLEPGRRSRHDHAGHHERRLLPDRRRTARADVGRLRYRRRDPATRPGGPHPQRRDGELPGVPVAEPQRRQP